MAIEIISIPFKKVEPFKVATIFNNTSVSEGKDFILVSDYYSDSEEFKPKMDLWGKEIPKYGISDSGAIVLQNMIIEKGIKSITLYPLERYSVMTCESGERKYRYETSFARLDKLIEKRKADCGKIDGIIFTGFWGLNKEFKNEFDAKKFGRVGKYKDIPCVHTLSINQVCQDKKGGDAEDNAALIGFIYNHIDNLIYGKNRYTVNTKGWVTHLVKTIEEFDQMMEVIKNSPTTSWDVETTGLSRTQEKLLTYFFLVQFLSDFYLILYQDF